MLDRGVRITNALGLHARAAAQLVRLANTFSSTIRLQREDNGIAANAKSILSVLQLAAGHDVALSIIADGEDEATAIEAIEKLFLDRFGEV